MWCAKYLQWAWDTSHALADPCLRQLESLFPPMLRSIHFFDSAGPHNDPQCLYLENCRSLQGFYLFEFWTPFSTHRPLYFFLSGESLCEALHVQDLEALWAFSQSSMWELLERYTHAFHEQTKMRYISVTYRGRCFPKELDPYQGALFLDRYVTVRALCRLYRHVTGTSSADPKKDDDAGVDKVVVLDYELHETERYGDELLWPGPRLST